MDEEYLAEFAKQYQKKYGHVMELQRLTRELGDILSRDDRVSASMILDMRQTEMTGLETCEKNIRILLESLDAGEREEAESCLLHGVLPDPGKQGYDILLRIRKIQERTEDVLREVVRLDQAVSRRVAGKDSFYAEKTGE